MGLPENQQGGNDQENLINDNKLGILNDKYPTYLNLSICSYSAIDVILCDPSSYMDYIGQVHDDPCGCDYFPKILKTTQPIHDNNRPPQLENK